MIKTWIFFFALLAGSAAAADEIGDAAVNFGAREAIQSIDISPDGQRVVYLAPGPEQSVVALVQELSGNQQPRAVARSSGNPERLRWCSFVANDRLVCRFSALVANTIGLVPFSRLISIDTDGRNLTELGQRESFYDAYLRQRSGDVLDWLPGENGVILMSRDYVPEAGRIGTRLVRTGEGLGVDRIDVRTLRATQVERPNRLAGSYITDGRGHVRIMELATVRGAGGALGSRTDYQYRTAGSSEWRPLGSYDALTHEGLVPLAVDPELDAAYVLRRLNGRFALYRIKLDGSMASELVYANEQVDVDDVVRAAHGSRIIGVTFAEGARQVNYFDEQYAALTRALSRAIPALPIIGIVGASRDGNRQLIHAGSDTDPGRYYVFDRQTRALNEILLARPQLEHVRLSTVRSISYPAADGVMIPAYLTLPAGSDGRNLPAIVLPHGGPEARDEWGFDWLSQYFAHLGYAVIQPNYRGSGGYGEAWLQRNGFRGWRTSIGDVTAAGRWLVSQGIADPNRLAIVGWSYGGYAALQAAVTEPRLFKAVVAIAPVTDLQQLKEDFEHFTNSRNIAEYVGSGPHIAEASPARNAARIEAPVLLFHGTRDRNVSVVHSQRMDNALRAAGKTSELTLFEGLEHDLDDSAARARMLSRTGAFLAASLGHR